MAYKQCSIWNARNIFIELCTLTTYFNDLLHVLLTTQRFSTAFFFAGTHKKRWSRNFTQQQKMIFTRIQRILNAFSLWKINEKIHSKAKMLRLAVSITKEPLFQKIYTPTKCKQTTLLFACVCARDFTRSIFTTITKVVEMATIKCDFSCLSHINGAATNAPSVGCEMTMTEELLRSNVKPTPINNKPKIIVKRKSRGTFNGFWNWRWFALFLWINRETATQEPCICQKRPCQTALCQFLCVCSMTIKASDFCKYRVI